jgi:hypothetical protein
MFTDRLLLNPRFLKKRLNNKPLFAAVGDRVEILDMDEEHLALGTRAARSTSKPQGAP